MIAIVCVDDMNGMIFNHRRQSQDVNVRQYILNICKDKVLWMSPYSAKQFGENVNCNNSEDYLLEAAPGEYCFDEDQPLLPYEKYIEQIVIFKWNRVYPSDMKFDIPLDEHNWKCISTDEFPGKSHKKISVEVYEK